MSQTCHKRLHRNNPIQSSASSEGLAALIGDVHLVVGQPGSRPMQLIPSTDVRVVAAAP